MVSCFFPWLVPRGPAAFFFFIAQIIFFVLVMWVSFLVLLVWLQDALRVAGALPALVEALTAHQGHAGVAEKACIALRNLAVGNAANRVTSMGGKKQPQLVGGGVMHIVWHVTGVGDEKKRRGEMTEWGSMEGWMGHGRAKIKMSWFSPCFFHGFYRFYTFSCISRASLAIFSPFFHSMLLFLLSHFPHLKFLWKNISERSNGVFLHHFLKMAQLSFPRSIFEILSRCVVLFLHTLARFKPPLYFFWQGLVLVFGRNFGARAKTIFFWPKILSFFVKCVCIYIG
jgi:hypothetical protein